MFRASTTNTDSSGQVADDDGIDGGPVLPRHVGDTTPPSQPDAAANPKRTGVKRALSSSRDLGITTRRPTWARYISVANKNHFVAAVGEYVGTTLFLLFAFGGTNVANIPSVSITENVNTSQLLYISLSFGFSLCVNAWVFFRVSGGLFNPAVSLGLTLVGALTPVRAAILVVSQLLGAMTGAAVIEALLPGPLYVGTTLAGGISVAQGLFLDMFLSSLLMLTILLLAAEKHKATFLAPVGIGLALFIAEMTGVYYTGGSLNPARSFGPAVVARSFPHYHWIYWLGPALGACLAAGFYKFIKYLSYEEVVPDQDGATDAPAPAPTAQGEHDAKHQSKLRLRIRRAEARTQEKLRVHDRAVGDGGHGHESAPADPTTADPTAAASLSAAASALQTAQLAELSTKMDAVLAALAAQATAAAAEAERQADVVVEAPHAAPFSVFV